MTTVYVPDDLHRIGIHIIPDSITLPILESDVTGLVGDLANKSDITHNHALNDLSEKSYNSLTDKPSIPTLPISEADVTNLVVDLGNKEPANANIQAHVTVSHEPANANIQAHVTVSHEPALPSKAGQALKYAQVKADETGFQYAIPTAALPDLVKTRRDTNGSNQTIETGYSVVVALDYTIGVADILQIDGTGAMIIL